MCRLASCYLKSENMRQGSVRGEVEQIKTGTFPQNMGSHVDSKRIIYAQGRVKLLLRDADDFI
jgi:hypothetical protein